MIIDDTLLKSEEKVVFRLRNLYRSYGYSYFKMSKFEEYDLYSRNKDFLVSDSVITFNDVGGRLMALKPDVTLSIVKNYRPAAGCVQRVFYNENVYRMTDKNHGYKEIMQAGLECLGDVTQYNLCEVTKLAAESLAAISDECVLNISHLGIISELLSDIERDEYRTGIIECIGKKNSHELEILCREAGVSAGKTDMLCALTEVYGAPENVIPHLKGMTADGKILAALNELESLMTLVKTVSKARLCVDFSIVNDMNYYNGIVFQGFVKGIPSAVLSGGQYDRLMQKMGKPACGVGFAVYLNLLEYMDSEDEYDTDILLLCSDNDTTESVMDRVSELMSDGSSVTVQKTVPDKLKFRKLERMASTGGLQNG